MLDGPAAVHRAADLLGAAVLRADQPSRSVRVATDGSAAHLRYVLDFLAREGVGVATCPCTARPWTTSS